MTEYQIRLALATVSFIVGLVIGYALAKSKSDSKITFTQVLFIAIFFAYLILAGTYDSIQYSDLVVITILAVASGEPIGKAIAKQVNKTKKKK